MNTSSNATNYFRAFSSTQKPCEFFFADFSRQSVVTAFNRAVAVRNFTRLVAFRRPRWDGPWAPCDLVGHRQRAVILREIESWTTAIPLTADEATHREFALSTLQAELDTLNYGESQ